MSLYAKLQRWVKIDDRFKDAFIGWSMRRSPLTLLIIAILAGLLLLKDALSTLAALLALLT